MSPMRGNPHFRRSTTQGHKGGWSSLEGHRVAVMQGRIHYYEGYSLEEVCYPLRVLRLLGGRAAHRHQRRRLHQHRLGCRRCNADHRSDQAVPGVPLRGESAPVRHPVSWTAPPCTPTPPGHRPAGGRRAGAFPCGRVYMFFPGPPVETPPRSGPPGSWGPTPPACPPPRRSSSLTTAAWRYWASPCCAIWRRGFWTSPGRTGGTGRRRLRQGEIHRPGAGLSGPHVTRSLCRVKA